MNHGSGKTLFDESWEALGHESGVFGEYLLTDGNENTTYILVKVNQRHGDEPHIAWQLSQDLGTDIYAGVYSSVEEGVSAALHHLRLGDADFPEVRVTLCEIECEGMISSSSVFAAGAMATLVAFERGHFAAVGGTVDGAEIFFLFP